MATNQNNIHINSFSKGMNTDTSLDMVGNEQYVFGQNIRITANALLKGAIDSNSKEGIVTPVPSGQSDHGEFPIDKYTILAIATLGNIGAIIIKEPASEEDNSAIWHIYRIDYNDDTLSFVKIFTSNEPTKMNRFSAVINKELSEVVKLYIADGEHEIMSINIYNGYEQLTSIDQLINNKYFPVNPAAINQKISGTLNTGQVQYTYRFYHRYGVSSKLAPLTTKIQVIDPSRSKETGNAEDTQTTIGFQLRIPLTSYAIDMFTHLQIYRLQYSKPNTNASVYLIYDSKLPDTAGDVKVNDDGIDPIQELSIEEFAALDTIDIIPQCIEQNQNYLFAANIKDNTRWRIDGNFDAKAYQFNGKGKIALYENNDTTYENAKEFDSVDDVPENYSLNKYSDMTLTDYTPDYYNSCKYDKDGYLGGSGKNVSWRFVTIDIPLDSTDSASQDNPPRSDYGNIDTTVYYLKNDHGEIKKEPAHINAKDVFEDHGILTNPTLSYNDMFTSSLFRSLKRDEVYRYGIVVYDKYGKRSDVQWIADIRTPSELEFSATSTVKTQDDYGDGFPTTITSGEFIYSRTRVQNAVSEYDYGQDYVGYKEIRLSDTTEGGFSIPNQYKVQECNMSQDSLCSGKISFAKTPSSDWQEEYGQPDFKAVEFENVKVKDLEQTLLNRLRQQLGDATVNLTVDVELVPSGVGAEKDTPFTILALWVRIGMSSLADYQYVSIVNFSITPVLNVRLSKQKSNEFIPDNAIYARPIGIQFDIHDCGNEIKAYQIVRCAKTAAYTKNLMQCVTSRPTWQNLNKGIVTYLEKKSPYYPLPFLTSDYVDTTFDMQSDGGGDGDTKDLRFLGDNRENQDLFQIFSPEIQFIQEDALVKLQSFVTQINPVAFAFGETLHALSERIQTVCRKANGVLNFQKDGDVLSVGDAITGTGVKVALFDRSWVKGADYHTERQNADKNKLSFISKYYNIQRLYSSDPKEIKDIKNVSNPTWDKGFSNININGTEISSGVKQYKSFSTSITSQEYVNWICNGMYDLRISNSMSQVGLRENVNGFCVMIEGGKEDKTREPEAKGWIGPGPRCFLASIKNTDKQYLANLSTSNKYLSTAIVNITHIPSQYAGLTKEEKQYDTYYGFGNIKAIGSINKFNVFDGDVYITPCEITSMYKAYDFNSYDTLPSAQLIYYVPLESTINTYFDYGMGYRNTQSKNVQIEPGEISGVASQARPEHQYNMIYSDNNVSNDVYTVQSIEDSDQSFPQRIHYSVLKTNGELIDNWQMFKALDYIDADTRYGDITELLTNRDVIYFWQEQAFGKLSVNERSLVTDNNSNTVQLGQGGVLQRTDYVNTRYGMRPQDHSAISAEGSVYWIDIINKAILMSNGQQVVNIGEQMNVQNCINKYFVDAIPTIHYDLQNNELVCKCLEDGKQMVFNIKMNIATSVYDRHYDDIIMFNNTLFGIIGNEVLKYNYIQGQPEYNVNTRLEFVVNNAASITKVFDNQEIVTLARGSEPSDYFDGKEFSFTTNIIDETKKNPEGYTDREGNVRYAIPRYAENYGNRMRGKWLKVDIEDSKPKYEHSISHILTKFRQSFS